MSATSKSIRPRRSTWLGNRPLRSEDEDQNIHASEEGKGEEQCVGKMIECPPGFREAIGLGIPHFVDIWSDHCKHFESNAWSGDPD